MTRFCVSSLTHYVKWTLILKLTGFSLDEIDGFDFDAGDEVEMPALKDGDKETVPAENLYFAR